VAVTPFVLPSGPAGQAPDPAAHPAPPVAPEDAREQVAAALESASWSTGLRRRGDEHEDDLYVFGAWEPEEVFGSGLRPCGDRLVHVLDHARDGGRPDSLWVTASRDIGWLRARIAAEEGAAGAEIANRYGWRYDIAAPGGVDVNATLDVAAPHPRRREVLFPGGVDGRWIRGAQRLEQGRPAGPYTINPGFGRTQEPGTATKGTAG
jgi:hypothetical protein